MPALAHAEAQHARALPPQERRELVVQVREADRVPGRQDDGLAPAAGEGQPVADRLAPVEHVVGIDRHRPVGRGMVGLEPGFLAHELQDLPGLQGALQPRHPELLVRIALEELPDVLEDVVERVAHLWAGDRGVHEGTA